MEFCNNITHYGVKRLNHMVHHNQLKIGEYFVLPDGSGSFMNANGLCKFNNSSELTYFKSELNAYIYYMHGFNE